jgi:protoporphyrinogen oxidase
MPDEAPVVIAGAGPGGLTAAYQLTKRGLRPLVLEADPVVGGISRTVVRDGWRFDLGGHRFFTKVPEVEALWHEILPEGDFLLRPRMSRIFYKGKYYDYPLKAMNAVRNLGVWESMLCGFSYVWARIRPPKHQENYEDWLVARFGWRLYRTFFKTYTERVWGVEVSEMPADWAAQRIKNLDLRKAVVNAILPKRNQKEITSLIEEFQYPKYGPGMMWEVCAEKVQAAGGTVRLSSRLTRIHVADGRAQSVPRRTSWSSSRCRT